MQMADIISPDEAERQLARQKWDLEKNRLSMELTNRREYYNAAKFLHDDTPYMYDEHEQWYVWNKSRSIYEKIPHETKIINLVRRFYELKGDAIIKGKANMIEAMREVGDEHKPLKLNSKFIQFKHTLYNIHSKEIIPAAPDKYCTNAIPWNIGTTTETPTIDDLFNQWVGEEYTPTLYEIIAFCTLREYSIHRIIALIGGGRNGKSTFIRLLDQFIGKENVVSTSFEELSGNNRFETYFMYEKLVATIDETNYGVVKNTRLLKQLTGGDKVRYEIKGKQAFSDYSYAKLVMSSNGYPDTEDVTDAYFSRWLFVEFSNQFPEGKDPLEDIPLVEFDNLARKCIEILPGLLRKKCFTNEGNIQKRKERYMLVANPFPQFVREKLVRDPDGLIRFGELYKAYDDWIRANNRRVISGKEFGQLLQKHDMDYTRTTRNIDDMKITDRFIFGWRFCSHLEKYAKNAQNDSVSTHLPFLSREGIGDGSFESSSVEKSTFTKFDLIQALKQFDNPQPINNITELFPQEPVDEWINELKNEGIVYEPKQNYVALTR